MRRPVDAAGRNLSEAATLRSPLFASDPRRLGVPRRQPGILIQPPGSWCTITSQVALCERFQEQLSNT